MNNINVAVIIGSNRKESFTKKIALNLEKLAAQELKFNFVDISKLSFYDQDLEESGKEPLNWIEFREEIAKSDAVLFLTPEYNRSMPAIIKNALDVGSRPYGKSVWNKLPGAIVSVSPGGLGAFGANHHLRQVLTFLNVPTMQQPEAYIGSVYTLLDEKGNLNNEDTKKYLKNFIDNFLIWINKNK